jgi:hypothetical protein
MARRFARVLANQALGDDEERQTDEHLKIGREVEEKSVPGRTPSHLAHKGGQDGQDAPGHDDQDEAAPDQVDRAPSVDSEHGEGPVDEVAFEEREHDARGGRMKSTLLVRTREGSLLGPPLIFGLAHGADPARSAWQGQTTGRLLTR